MSGAPVMEVEVFAGVFEGVDESVCRVPLRPIQDRRSFLGLIGPVLGALKLPGRGSMVPGGAKPVLGTP
jgi:hypothetical protein